MIQLLLLLLRTLFAAARSRRDVALENLVLRHQLQVALRTNPTPRLRGHDRVLWVWLRRLWPGSWRQHLQIVQPETVLGWHRKGWRVYWTWKARTRLGHPRLSAEDRHRGQQPFHPSLPMAEAAADREPELADLLVQSAWRHLGGRPVSGPDREPPDALRFILCPPPAAGTRPLQRHRQSDRRLDLTPAPGGHSLEPTATFPPPRLIVIDERHLHAVLTEFAAYYNRDRPHRSLGLQAPIPGEPVTRGAVISRPVLGGLHHVYARAA